jgi:serine/threonine protein kinase
MGLLIMHLLTGKPPIKKGSFVNVVKDILAGRIERPKKYLNHPLNDVLSRATALDPKERYADALEFKSALAEIRGHV